MSATLGELVVDLGARIVGPASARVGDVAYDSRQIRPGALFAALRGAQTDGHRFIPDALRAGASALLVEEPPGERPAEVGIAVVADTRRALADVAARFFEFPARALSLVGVTGTKGKTSTVRMCESVLGAGGRRAGSLGTISVRWPGFEEKAAMTTPGVARPAALARANARRAASRRSRSRCPLTAWRWGACAACASRWPYSPSSPHDHLDFHGDLESYGRAKALLFAPELLAGTAVLNVADPWTKRLAELARSGGNQVVTYGRGAESGADYTHARRAHRAVAARACACADPTRSASSCSRCPATSRSTTRWPRSRSGAPSGCRGTMPCAGSRPARRCPAGWSGWASRRRSSWSTTRTPRTRSSACSRGFGRWCAAS